LRRLLPAHQFLLVHAAFLAFFPDNIGAPLHAPAKLGLPSLPLFHLATELVCKFARWIESVSLQGAPRELRLYWFPTLRDRVSASIVSPPHLKLLFHSKAEHSHRVCSKHFVFRKDFRFLFYCKGRDNSRDRFESIRQ
jgi:hypothetical protein